MENQSTVTSARLLVEPLTRREVDILKMLALNLTNREIAGRLFLALSSVKWYTNQIYAKLGVENRHQAVERARELGILPISAYMRPTHNLPRQISRFIGREKEIVRVVELIREHSLITLTGPGGVGKTRLALACAEELLDDFINGIWFIEIAPLSDPLLVERTLADVLGVHEDPDRSLRDSLVSFLGERQVMLVFDNCEHMLDACTSLANDLLKSLPLLKVLVSSREPLGLTGEAVFRVPSLAFPTGGNPLTPDQIREFEAVRLFEERARAAQPDLQLDESSTHFVAQICRRLDGIPLAIELAASRVAGLGVELIAARLDQSFRLLSGSRTALERHRTLNAAIEWSYTLLAEKERLLLRRLTVFVGGCTLEAAEAVCSREPIQPEEILDLLFQLTNKSMLVVEPSRTGEMRYRLLETIRQYAEDKQDDPGEIERLRRKHCDWFVQFAELAESRLSTWENLIWVRKLEADIDNLRATLEWSIGQNADPGAGMRLINALVKDFLCNYYYASETRRWTEKGLAALAGMASVSPILQARSLLSKVWLSYYITPYIDPNLFDRIFELCQELGDEGKPIQGYSLLILGIGLAYSIGDLQKGMNRLNEAEAILRSMGELEKWFLICALFHKVWVWIQLGDLDEALACARECSTISHELGSPWTDIDDVGLGDLYYISGDFAAAELVFKKAVLKQPELNDPRRIDHWLRKLGDAYRAQRKFEQAISTFQEALRWTVEMANWKHVVWLQCCFALTAIGQAREQQSEDAKAYLLRVAFILGAIQPVMEETGAKLPIEYQAEYDRDMGILSERLDPAELEAAWTKGCSMNRKQVVAYLLEDTTLPRGNAS